MKFSEQVPLVKQSRVVAQAQAALYEEQRKESILRQRLLVKQIDVFDVKTTMELKVMQAKIPEHARSQSVT